MRLPTINIPDYWTDAEALAVFEFIDRIKDHIWDHYCREIQAEAKATRYINITMVDLEDEEQDDFVDDQLPLL